MGQFERDVWEILAEENDAILAARRKPSTPASEKVLQSAKSSAARTNGSRAAVSPIGNPIQF